MWDATSTLEALGAADVALWVWEPERDRMRLTGATRALGLGPLAPDCSSAALRALALPQDRAFAEDILRVQEPGTEVAVRMRMRGVAWPSESPVWSNKHGWRSGRAGWLAKYRVLLLGQNQFSIAGMAQRINFAAMIDQHFSSSTEQCLALQHALRLYARTNIGIGCWCRVDRGQGFECRHH
jgi:c-di-GMP-specific phosphodiesterase